jgi:AraC-like DNA-binding protein
MDQALTILEKNRAKRPLEASLLFFGNGKRLSGEKADSHEHPFWQLEIIKSGGAIAGLEKGVHELDSGQALLIPPGQKHSFKYSELHPETHFFSMKFNIENLEGSFEARILKSSNEIDFLIKNLKNLLEMEKSMKTFRIIEHLLAALVELQFSQRTINAKEPGFVSKVKEITAGGNWEKLSPEFVAKKSGYSKVHLSRLFKGETGMTLKAFLDNERYKSAKRLLLYSEYNISEISEKLNFPDPFCFSRFFKRLHGKSPREFKKTQV